MVPVRDRAPRSGIERHLLKYLLVLLAPIVEHLVEKYRTLLDGASDKVDEGDIKHWAGART